LKTDKENHGKTILKNVLKKFGVSEIKLEICNRFKREVQQK